MNVTRERSFREQIGFTYQRLLGVSEGHARLSFREGGWSRGQILGHLIDSALNNHQRFVRAALDGGYDGPSYQQAGWVSIHGYASMPWSTLLAHWRSQNELLCDVVERIPESRLDAQCTVGDERPVTLLFLIEDYLVHLDYHVAQITAP